MDLAIAIKNTILIVLIVLIFHFWLKSTVLEKKMESYVPLLVPVKDEKKQDLLKYVSEGDDELDRYFKNNVVTADVEEASKSTDVCTMKRDDQQLPLAQTCDIQIQKIDPVEDESLRIKAECGLKQDKKNIMILAEYENEKDINGGMGVNDLNAFDTFDVNYESL
jgi:hypothetical protein